MSVFLSSEDLHRLTGKTRYTAQRRALDRLGIKYVKAATGEPLVRSDQLDKQPGRPAYIGPRWDLIASPPKRRAG